jgi:Protein of unknown function (DUF2934)
MNKLDRKLSRRVLQSAQNAGLAIEASVDRQVRARIDPPGNAARMPHPIPTQEDIRNLAYEIYEKRGRESGQDEQDWLRAEKELTLVGIRFG